MNLFLQELHFVISSKFWLLFIFLFFCGMMGWLAYMAATQQRILRTYVTRDEFTKAFAAFRKERQGLQ